MAFPILSSLFRECLACEVDIVLRNLQISQRMQKFLCKLTSGSEMIDAGPTLGEKSLAHVYLAR